MRQLFAGLLLMIFVMPAWAQKTKTPYDAPLKINASYFGGTWIYPGAKLGIELPLKAIEKNRVRRNGKDHRPVYKEWFLSGNIGGFNQSQYNTQMFVNAEIGRRKIIRGGLKLEALLGVGYLRTFRNIPTYELTTSDELQKVSAAGQSGFMPSLSFGIGYDHSVKGDLPISWHIRPNFYLQVPYNHTYLPQVALEVGVSYHLK